MSSFPTLQKASLVTAGGAFAFTLSCMPPMGHLLRAIIEALPCSAVCGYAAFFNNSFLH